MTINFMMYEFIQYFKRTTVNNWSMTDTNTNQGI